MTGRFLGATAVAALLAIGLSAPTLAQTSGSTGSQSQMSQDRSMQQDTTRKSSTMRSTRPRQTAQGQRRDDNIADQLNACELKPQAERQSCIDAARHM